MQTKKRYLLWVVVFALALVVGGCGKKTTTNTTNTAATNEPNNANAIPVGGEAPYILSGVTKVFALKLVNGSMNYTTMTFSAGDSVRVTLTSDDQPVDFRFVNPDVRSTSGVFSTQIAADDRGGVYQLVCVDRECGTVTVTVVPNSNTNSSANTNAANTNIDTVSSITNVELQRIPAGATFSPSNTYETTSTFSVGDQFGMGITGSFATGSKMTYRITNNSGQTVDGPSAEFDLQNGTNGRCCFAVPSSAGTYRITFSVNDAEEKSVPITVQ